MSKRDHWTGIAHRKAPTVTEGDRELRRCTHLRTLIAHASEGFVVIDGTGNIRVLSEAAVDVFDIARDAAVGAPIETLGCTQLQAAVRSALIDGPDARTLRITHRGRHLGCTVTAYSDDHESGVAVVVRDDSELFEQQERLEAILSSVGDGLIVFTPDDCVTFVNPAAVELLGESLLDAVGNQAPLSGLLGLEPADASQCMPCWQTRACGVVECPQYGSEDLRCWLKHGTPGPDGEALSFRDKQERCVGCDIRAVNGPALGDPGAQGTVEIEIAEPEHRFLEVRTSPVTDRDGHYLGCISTLHDVTATREIAIMKNEFVSMVSHELRTPLTSIKGYVDLIVDGEAGEINDVQREFLQIVQENSDRLVSLINDLLDISRIESGRVHLRIEPLEPIDIINGVMGTFRTYADQSGITLTARIPSDLPRVAVDGDRIGQVLMNLTSNAIKYSPGGGEVTLGASHAGDFVEFRVTDTGLGISEEDQRQLFNKFFRVDSSLTREIGGTGLGLSICKSVVELHGGAVSVTSVLGEGSTFGFSVPIAPSELIRMPAVEGPVKTHGGTVLVIDRDPEIASLIETFLIKRGYDVMKAHTAREALAAAADTKPSLITLDVLLDDHDGFDLLQHLKEDPATADVPVVVLSIVTDEGKSLRLGAADYLEKPIDKSRLIKLVDDLVGAKASPVILVVDDDRHIADSLAHTLRARGFAVAQAYNGQEAMQAVEATPPDLILLDLKMPVMDGYEVIQSVKGNAETRHIPIVVMTAHRIDHDKTDILKLAAEHVSKPFEPETLAMRVAAVLGADEELA
ncbi:MAG: response regulator [Coriobacteriia bacterium]|nr:response regulator [Coriobacteriia bacterium]